MNRQPEVIRDGEVEQFKAGKFHFTAEGTDVLITKDTADGIITVNMLTYKSHERAAEAAWRLACLQAKA